MAKGVISDEEDDVELDEDEREPVDGDGLEEGRDMDDDEEDEEEVVLAFLGFFRTPGSRTSN
ncbi:putative transcription elongation factor SPT6 isoform X1 [Sesbania bispinosa]|nr:putative transcription elongation factor SPT6 isoform X1 [Sesbania bispinosa]